MIEVTRLDDSTILINPHRIISVEKTPDTIITISTGTKLMVKETVEEVRDKFVRYQTMIRTNPEQVIIRDEENGM